MNKELTKKYDVNFIRTARDSDPNAKKIFPSDVTSYKKMPSHRTSSPPALQTPAAPPISTEDKILEIVKRRDPVGDSWTPEHTQKWVQQNPKFQV
jgi:hypothetical protein